MKKRTLTIAIALVCMLVLIGGTAAYISKEYTATNAVTASDLSVELVMPGATSKPVVPGQEFDGGAAVENTGSQDAWVRVKLTQPEDIELIGVDTENWTEKDGAWYYNHILKAGDKTPNLFSGLKISENLDNDDSDKSLSLLVKGQATQFVNNGDTAMDAQGWPEE